MTGPDIAPAAPCDPYVTTFVTAGVDKIVVRCPCGREDVAWATAEEAEQDRDDHRAGRS